MALDGIILAGMNTGHAGPRLGVSAEERYRADTLLDLYRAVWRVTGRQQLLLIGLSVTVAALAAAPLKFQQLVVNRLVEGADIRRVAWLCAGFLAVALLSTALKFVLTSGSRSWARASSSWFGNGSTLCTWAMPRSEQWGR